MDTDEPTTDGGEEKAEQRGYLKPYEQAADTHGPSFEATLWLSQEKQLARFEVFAQEIDLAGRSIVDAGCGLADLAAYLVDQGIEFERYLGLEGVRSMAEQAEARGLPRARVFHADFAGHESVFEDSARGQGRDMGIDVTLFSGALNTFQMDHALEVVDRAWRVSTHAVGFNFLTSRHHKKSPVNPAPAVRFDPVRVLDWALERTPSVLFRQDYFEGHDGTVIMWKPGEVPPARWSPRAE